MPFPEGAVLLLTQGNSTSDPYSHSFPNTQYALDFCGFETSVVAAADGLVGQVFTQATPEDPQAGFGFGNFVKLQHQAPCYSFYAHLDRVLVEVGQPVRVGERIGSMGNTGWAGGRHLHFSLHAGEVYPYGVGPSIPMKALVCADLQVGLTFRSYSSEDLRDFRNDPRKIGFLYASENSPDRCALEGDAPSQLQDIVRQNRMPMEQLLQQQAIGVWPFADPKRSQA